MQADEREVTPRSKEQQRKRLAFLSARTICTIFKTKFAATIRTNLH